MTKINQHIPTFRWCPTVHFCYSHCNSLVSMSSSSVSSSTTTTTQVTRTQLKPADSRQTCHSAALRPQHGLSQLDLSRGAEGGRRQVAKNDKLWFCYSVTLKSDTERGSDKTKTTKKHQKLKDTHWLKWSSEYPTAGGTILHTNQNSYMLIKIFHNWEQSEA